MSQADLWKKVILVKQSVRDAIGTGLDREFKSTQAYQAYTGLCAEAQIAYEGEELSEEIVEMLENWAKKVIELHSKQMA